MNVGRCALRWFGALALLGTHSVVYAHTRMTVPPPRDTGDAHKTAPCGDVARTTTATPFDQGATITVEWEETISHQGCFQIALSTADDKNFTVLKQIDDPAGGAGTVYSEKITLPQNVTCAGCTLVVRQLMLGAPCTQSPQNDLDASTYYSCADIRIGAGAPSDAGAEDAAATPAASTSPDTMPDSGAASATRHEPVVDSACSIGRPGAGGFPALASVFALSVALLAKRRRARRARG